MECPNLFSASLPPPPTFCLAPPPLMLDEDALLLWTLFVPIFQNPCLTDPCPHNFACQVEFREQGYRCASGMQLN